MHRVKTFTERNALLLKLGAHGRIDIGVRATDLHAQLLGQQGQTAHECSADSQYMYVHGNSCKLLGIL